MAEKRKARVAELLPRAFAFAEKGAVAEAIATAEEAAGLVPTSIAAHTLLANLYEKSGQMTRAIESMKKVVALTPDGIEEKTRLNDLQREATRRAVSLPEKDDEMPTSPIAYWVPRIGAALAGALVVGIGLSLLMRPNEPQTLKPRRGGTPAMIVGDQSLGTAFASTPFNKEPTVPRQVFIPAPVGAEVDPFVEQGICPYRGTTACRIA
ncbi:MAG: tetratricopeptide repeat protein [Armatimonas sp.]